MRLGKKVAFGGLAAAIAVHAHGLLACELHRDARVNAEAIHKPVKVIEVERVVRIERPDTGWISVPSRRVILQ